MDSRWLHRESELGILADYAGGSRPHRSRGGPASALYGSNAISGVINIITLTPEQADGLTATRTAGMRESGRASLLYGNVPGALQVMASTEFSTVNQFEAADKSANQVIRGRTQVRYQRADGGLLSLSSGASDLRTELSQGGLGKTYEDGQRGFLHAAFEQGNHHLRASWMGGSTRLESFKSRLDYATLEVQGLSSMILSGSELVIGAEIRRDALDAAFCVHASLRYRLDRWNRAFEVQLTAFNALDNRHHQVLSNFNFLATEQSGEKLRVAICCGSTSILTIELCQYQRSTRATSSIGKS